MSDDSQIGSVFIAFASASGLPYLLIRACCPSSVNSIFASPTFVSSGFVLALTFAVSVFIKLCGMLLKNFITFGSTGFPSNVSGASVMYSQKFAVWSATNALNASESFSSPCGTYVLPCFMSFNV